MVGALEDTFDENITADEKGISSGYEGISSEYEDISSVVSFEV